MTDLDLDEPGLIREFDHDAEIAVVGAVMKSRGRLLDELDLTADHFGDPIIGAAYGRLVEVYAERRFVDYVAFGDSLTARPIPGVKAHDLLGAADRTPSVENGRYYAQVVRRWAVKRELRAAGSWIAQHAPTAEDVDALADTARKRIDAAVAAQTGGVTTIGESIYRTLAKLEEPDPFTPTPWPSLDYLIGGLRPGALYVVGARPGAGKSILGGMIALDTARRGKWAALSSLEMDRGDLEHRWIAQSGRVLLEHLQRRTMTQADYAAAGEVAAKLADLPIAVDDRAAQTVWDVRHHARSVARKGPLGVVVVDYLQLMRGTPDLKGQSRERVVAEMSRALKVLAKEMSVPVVALCQLNRGPADRKDEGPRMSDLRESGALEQDADAVILLHRDPDASPDLLFVGLPKNRHGQVGGFSLTWEAHYGRVVEMRWSPSSAVAS